MRKVSDLISRALDRPDMSTALQANKLLRRWPEVVGSDLAKRCSPDRFERGTVFVAVEGSAWAQELRMHKDDLLARLNALSDKPLFTDIRFGVRSFVPMTTTFEEAVAVVEVQDPRVDLSIKEIAERRLQNYPDAPRA